MANFAGLNRLFIQRIRPALQRRLVSTSKKNNDTVTADVTKTAAKTEEKNWVSYGYDFNSKAEDRNVTHAVMFASITLCLVVGGM